MDSRFGPLKRRGVTLAAEASQHEPLGGSVPAHAPTAATVGLQGDMLHA